MDGAPSAVGVSGGQDRIAPRILLVEDEPLVRGFTARLLQHAGYEVHLAGDGDAAWVALRHCRFQLLVTDNRMPLLTGVELIGRLRASGSVLAAILMSGAAQLDFAAMPLKLDPLIVLEKPFTGSQLLAKVRAALSSPSAAPDSVSGTG